MARGGDWHRSFAFYENLFQRNGFAIESVAEDDGVDVDSLESVGEHLVFSLKKSEFYDLSDCTLLVKACAMDHQIAGCLIRNTVRKLDPAAPSRNGSSWWTAKPPRETTFLDGRRSLFGKDP